MGSPAGTSPVREWRFVLHPEQRPDTQDSDRFDHAPALAGGTIGWEEDPDGVRFPCAVRAEYLEEAVIRAIRQMTDLGMPVARVDMVPPLAG